MDRKQEARNNGWPLGAEKFSVGSIPVQPGEKAEPGARSTVLLSTTSQVE